jgi:hypothetical protein
VVAYAADILLLTEWLVQRLKSFEEDNRDCPDVTVGRVSTARLLGMCGNHG